jgi:hypothetical protein
VRILADLDELWVKVKRKEKDSISRMSSGLSWMKITPVGRMAP